MAGPIISFVTWNRAGLTARNLTALFETTDDFELHIIDNHSQDNTWGFIQSLKDERIKEIKRFDKNRGVTYAINYVLAQRKKDQYYIHLDNDLHLITKDWITQFMKVMDTFQEVGVLGSYEPDYFLNRRAQPIVHEKDGTVFYQYAGIGIRGSCCCFRPELLDVVGYWNEETYRNDSDMTIRIEKFTNFTFGYVPTVLADVKQSITCEQCLMKESCSVKNKAENCFGLRRHKYIHDTFPKISVPKMYQYLEEVRAGKRTVYCASIHDIQSIKDHYYNKEWAEENFQYFIDYAN